MATTCGVAQEAEPGLAPARHMTLDEIVERFARDGEYHLTNGPATAAELLALERAVGHSLPDSFRTFLARLGGGLFYAGHEIFGPHRVMVHDIELVPSLTAIRTGPCAERIPEGLVPFHRMGGTLHAFDLRGSAGAGRIVAFPYGSTYPELASFLDDEVLPPATQIRT
jgi:SMI1/KNR4 family protein SUKH-1